MSQDTKPRIKEYCLLIFKWGLTSRQIYLLITAVAINYEKKIRKLPTWIETENEKESFLLNN